MTDNNTTAKRRQERASEVDRPPLRWPGNPDQGDGIDVDFEAVAHVLANTCRWGGRTRRFLSLAQHGLIASQEIEALEGIADDDRRSLALYALLADARAAWLGNGEEESPASDRAAARARTHGAKIERAVREAAGLDPEPPKELAEVLRFVERMTDAAERRDLRVSAAGFPFPPLRRTIRPMAPEAAAERWLARFRALRQAEGNHGSATGEGSRSPAGDGGSP